VPRAPRLHRRRRPRFKPKDTEPKRSIVRPEINVTPLVDVVLVLLIIFMVVTPLLHRGVDLDLPKTRHHTTRRDTGEQLVVSVRGGGMFLEGNRVPLERLGALLDAELKNSPSRPVNVHADRSLKFGDVRKVLEQVHASGAATVNMETRPESAEPTPRGSWGG